MVRTGTRQRVIAGLALLVLLFGGLGVWASVVRISGAVIASGQLGVIGDVKTVQHLEGGMVDELLVAENDYVGKDQLLARMDDTIPRANLEIYSTRVQEALARQGRLEAVRDGLAESVLSMDDDAHRFHSSSAWGGRLRFWSNRVRALPEVNVRDNGKCGRPPVAAAHRTIA